MDLSGQTVVVTGGSSGIGEAVARDLAQCGAKIMVTARREQRLRRLAEELPECAYLAGDLTDPSLPSQVLEKALLIHGGCDVVINNAGIIETGSVSEINIERLCRMVRLNVEAAYRMAYLALRLFQKQGWGHLINVSSVLGTKTRERAGGYAGTKFALEALSEALRMELAGSDVKVSCVQPGLVRTELHEHYEEHPADTLGMEHPLRPQDVARSVRFLLDQPSHVRIPRLLVLPGEGKI
ncbi:MAG TPA: SDR family oxidoreductase [Acidobacteriota bacterium]|nr:SDR family oxidoreductase [Acidobacteriota bacterium]